MKREGEGETETKALKCVWFAVVEEQSQMKLFNTDSKTFEPVSRRQDRFFPGKLTVWSWTCSADRTAVEIPFQSGNRFAGSIFRET